MYVGERLWLTFSLYRIIQAVEKTVMSIHIEEDEYNSKSDSLDVSIINLNDNKRQMDVRFPPEEKKDDEEEDDEEEVVHLLIILCLYTWHISGWR